MSLLTAHLSERTLGMLLTLTWRVEHNAFAILVNHLLAGSTVYCVGISQTLHLTFTRSFVVE